MDAIIDPATSASPAGLRNSLTLLFETARRTASERGWPVLASLTVSLQTAPQRAVPEAGDCFYWEQPSKGIRLGGAGEAVAFEADEDGTRFELLQDRVEGLFTTAVVEPIEAKPMALAGFGFDADAWRDGTWDGFPDGVIFIPRLLC